LGGWVAYPKSENNYDLYKIFTVSAYKFKYT